MKSLIGLVAVAMALAFGLPGPAWSLLDAPQNVACELETDAIGEELAVTWGAVDGATKYSVDVIAGYEVDGVTQSVDFSFGTSDRTDGALISAPFLNIALSDLAFTADGVTIFPSAASVSVKGLDSGGKVKKDKGAQNNPFSELVECSGF